MFSPSSLAIQNHNNSYCDITTDSSDFDFPPTFSSPSQPHVVEEGYEYLTGHINQPLIISNTTVNSFCSPDTVMVTRAMAVNEMYRTTASAVAAIEHTRREREENAVRSARQRVESAATSSQLRKDTIARDKSLRQVYLLHDD